MPERMIYNYTFDVTRELESFQTMPDESDDVLHYGVELEVQPKPELMEGGALSNGSPTDVALNACYDAMENFMLIKSDSSIGGGGFEIVTAPASKLKQEHEWAKFLNGVPRKITKSWPTRTCGMHVHIGNDHFDAMQLGKFMMFFNMPANQEFIFKLSGRTQLQLNKWAQLAPQSTLSAGLTWRQPGRGGRSSAVNITNGKTVEVRIFRGNVQAEGFMKNLQSVIAAYDFCRSVSARRLKYTDFCDWLTGTRPSAEYPQLIEWCKSLDFIGTTREVKRGLVATYKKGE